MQLVPDALMALEETMPDQGQLQTVLHITLMCLECQGQDPDRGANACRSGGYNDDDDPCSDFLPMIHKLEFSKFDNKGDPLPWLNRCEWYFHVRHMLDHKCGLRSLSPHR
jgi:hypothetical protein